MTLSDNEWVSVTYRVIFVSSWSERRSCRERSSQDTTACVVPSLYEPSHSSVPALTCPEHATETKPAAESQQQQQDWTSGLSDTHNNRWIDWTSGLSDTHNNRVGLVSSAHNSSPSHVTLSLSLVTASLSISSTPVDRPGVHISFTVCLIVCFCCCNFVILYGYGFLRPG